MRATINDAVMPARHAAPSRGPGTARACGRRGAASLAGSPAGATGRGEPAVRRVGHVAARAEPRAAEPLTSIAPGTGPRLRFEPARQRVDQARPAVAAFEAAATGDGRPDSRRRENPRRQGSGAVREHAPPAARQCRAG
ncbi:hypothetical protein [Burkholderia plantarii]|uniref:hypothetical protein n=1 Tax=Burkholderia plantarii TaxID=41899 RepID=UPI000F4E947A|nr:hypothetical protein [Burkholderia plantarii]